nr:hypothetical protein [Staphylospora marina]
MYDFKFLAVIQPTPDHAFPAVLRDFMNPESGTGKAAGNPFPGCLLPNGGHPQLNGALPVETRSVKQKPILEECGPFRCHRPVKGEFQQLFESALPFTLEFIGKPFGKPADQFPDQLVLQPSIPFFAAFFGGGESDDTFATFLVLFAAPAWTWFIPACHLHTSAPFFLETVYLKQKMKTKGNLQNHPICFFFLPVVYISRFAKKFPAMSEHCREFFLI